MKIIVWLLVLVLLSALHGLGHCMQKTVNGRNRQGATFPPDIISLSSIDAWSLPTIREEGNGDGSSSTNQFETDNQGLDAVGGSGDQVATTCEQPEPNDVADGNGRQVVDTREGGSNDDVADGGAEQVIQSTSRFDVSSDVSSELSKTSSVNVNVEVSHSVVLKYKDIEGAATGEFREEDDDDQVRGGRNPASSSDCCTTPRMRAKVGEFFPPPFVAVQLTTLLGTVFFAIVAVIIYLATSFGSKFYTQTDYYQAVEGGLVGSLILGFGCFATFLTTEMYRCNSQRNRSHYPVTVGDY
eukprot:GHVQ01000702.1.p1 GENE.GHVQ01000702.1~~GHVQ01000702.1.p1  ORF type:complete len:298 (+),score=57.10 GHVQ01000702.1:271-1164(+)